MLTTIFARVKIQLFYFLKFNINLKKRFLSKADNEQEEVHGNVFNSFFLIQMKFSSHIHVLTMIVFLSFDLETRIRIQEV